VKKVEDFLRSQIPANERSTIISELGLNPDWSSAYTTNAGQQDSILRVQLLPKRSKSAGEYAVQLRQAFRENPAFADLQAEFDTGGMISTALNLGATSPIDIEIEGGTTAELLAAARKIANLVRPIPGTADVRIRQRDDASYLVLDVDRIKAAQLGLSAEDVILQVVVALNSSVSGSSNSASTGQVAANARANVTILVALAAEVDPGCVVCQRFQVTHKLQNNSP
jgi:Cu/Ag efflux pump CusA